MRSTSVVEGNRDDAVEEIVNLKNRMEELESQFISLEKMQGDACVVYGVDGTVIRINPHFERMFGWSLEELKGKKIPYVPESEEAITKETIRVALNGDSSPYETKRLTKDGRLLNVVISGSSFRDSSGKVAGLAVIIRDSTRSTELDALLHEYGSGHAKPSPDDPRNRPKSRGGTDKPLSDHSTQGLFDPMADGLAFLELAGDSTRINKKLAKMLGYAMTDLRSSDKLQDLVLPKAGLGNDELLEMIGRQGELVCHEIQLARKKGDKINVIVNAAVVRRRLDGNHLVVLSVTDIAARNKLEDRLRHKLHNLSTYAEALEDQLRARRRDLQTSNARIQDYQRKIERMKKGAQTLFDSVEKKRGEVTRTIEQSLGRTVQPIIDHLMSTQVTEAQRHLLKILDFNIKRIASDLGVNCSNPQRNLTPRETQICHMIREGMNSRKIAAATGLTFQTIITHRKKIRKKLGIAKAKLNLEMYIKDNLQIEGA